MKGLAVPLGALLLTSCAAKEPSFEVRREIMDVPAEYPGVVTTEVMHSVFAGDPDDEWHRTVHFQRGMEDVVTVQVPRRWVSRVVWVGMQPHGKDRLYIFLLAQMETPEHKRAEVAMRYLSNDDIFIRSNGEWIRTQPRRAYKIESADGDLVEIGPIGARSRVP